MNIVMIVLRLLHIFAGIAWAGAAFLTVRVVQPTLAETGEQAALQKLLGSARFGQYMGIAAGVTVLAGAILYGIDYIQRPGWLTSASGLTLTLGALAGIAAGIMGVMVTTRVAARLGALGQTIGAQGGPPTEAQLAELRGLQARLRQDQMIAITLMVIAIIGMAAFRYL